MQLATNPFDCTSLAVGTRTSLHRIKNSKLIIKNTLFHAFFAAGCSVAAVLEAGGSGAETGSMLRVQCRVTAPSHQPLVELQMGDVAVLGSLLLGASVWGSGWGQRAIPCASLLGKLCLISCRSACHRLAMVVCRKHTNSTDSWSADWRGAVGTDMVLQ
jgi:hypothetical protein